MPANRYYLPIDFTLTPKAFLEGEEFYHLSRVMRVKEGKTVELINGKGALAIATVLTLHPRKAALVIQSVFKKPPKLPFFALVQALLPLPQLKRVVQKSVELGVGEIFFFQGARGEKKGVALSCIDRLKPTTIAAMKQCGRLDLPKLTPLAHLEKIPSRVKHLIFGDLRAEAKPLLEIPTLKKSDLGIVIGPESGFTLEEMALLERHYLATGAQLHPYTLRAETAAIAALSCAALVRTF